MADQSHPFRSPVQDRSALTKERILEHARLAFAENGFEAASVRDIAEAAGTKHSMIRYHFGSKEQLWREAVREMFQNLAEETAEPDDEAALPFEERFKRFVRRYVRYSARHPDHARITIMETIRGGDRLSWMVDEFVVPGHADFLPNCERMIAQGALPDVWLPSLLYSIVGMAQMPFVLAAEAREALDVDILSDEAIERHADAVTALLFRG